MNEILDLTIERPVAGGRMLARHDGRVVFVSGAIPGERVRARVERANRQAWWAATTEVVAASPDRRDPPHDPACGGSAFAHIRYDRQRELKQQILVDAFRRLARVALEAPPAVAASPEQGYRLRARLHCAQHRVGYYLEGTHTMCDAAATAQLLPDATRSAQALLDALGAHADAIDAITVSENVAATERVLHMEPRGGADAAALAGALRPLMPSVASRDDNPATQAGVTGVTMVVGRTLQVLSGRAAVVDLAPSLFGENAPVAETTRWSRRAPAFFQANRYLIGSLVRRVLAAAGGDRVVDLYAGVGLFSVALAARGAQVVAVEGEPFAIEDLRSNAIPWQENLEVVAAPVEEIVRRPPPFTVSAVVLDPPRTGLSDVAQAGIAAWRVPTLVYVSCDPATLARDAAKFLAAGYQLAALDAFDLFPNTPHVEAVAVFKRIQ